MNIVPVELEDFKLVFGANKVKDTSSSDKFYIVEDVAGVQVDSITGELEFYDVDKLENFKDEDLFKVMVFVSPGLDRHEVFDNYNFVTGERFVSDKDELSTYGEEILAYKKLGRTKLVRIAYSALIPILFAIVLGLLFLMKG